MFDKTPVIANGHMFQRHCQEHSSYVANTSYFTDTEGSPLTINDTLTMINEVKSKGGQYAGGANKDKMKFDSGAVKVRTLKADKDSKNTAIAVSLGTVVGNSGFYNNRPGYDCQWLVLVVTNKLNSTGRYDWVSCYPATDRYVTTHV
jgi:hypothetical protein